jgi:hypothetical protein
MTKSEVVAAQRAWAKHVTENNVDQLLDFYDFGTPSQPLRMKFGSIALARAHTLGAATPTIRTTKAF